jgi:hypothetical protein
MLVTHADRIAKYPPVRAQYDSSAWPVELLDAIAKVLKKLESTPFGHIGQSPKDLGRVGGLAWKCRQNERDWLPPGYRGNDF